MRNKTSGAILFLLLACVAGFGQTSFQGITAGKSMRSDVARALGQPVRDVSETLSEYSPPQGIDKVYVQYRKGTQIVERLEVLLLKPVLRSALIKKFDLPQQAEARQTDGKGKLLEYFGGQSWLVFTYASSDVTSGVSSIGYYSRELFDGALAKAPGARQNPGTQSGPTRSGSGDATGLAPAELPGYMRPPAERAPGGTSYQGLMPGKSTRVDVDRLLGQAVKEHSQVLVEYRPNQQTQSKIYVQYRKGSSVVERIEILLAQPRNRADTLAVLHLPEQSTTTRVSGKGNLEEYFGPPFYMALTYQGANTSIGVIRTERYSRELFESALNEKFSGAANAAGNNSISVRRSDLPSSPRQQSCFAADPGAGVIVRSSHYNWATQQDSGVLDRNLRYKLGLLFQCPSVSDDHLANAFANISVLVARYVPNANCFNGNRGVISTDVSVHYGWARSRSRQEVLNNLASKVSLALKCLERNAQNGFFADASVVIAGSGG